MKDTNLEKPGIYVTQINDNTWYWEAWYYTEYGAMYHATGERKGMLRALMAALWAYIVQEGY